MPFNTCGCGHEIILHEMGRGRCREWRRYPEVLDARQCGCIAPWQRPAPVKPSDPTVFRIEETLRWNREQGELETLVNDRVTDLVEVRKRLLDDIVRQAVIIELERLGYTVISPEAD